MDTAAPAMRRSRLVVLAIPGFILAIGVAALLDGRGIYEPKWLLPVANLLFLFLPGCLVAYVSLQGYRSSGSVSLLLFGSAAPVAPSGGPAITPTNAPGAGPAQGPRWLRVTVADHGPRIPAA